MHMRMRRHISHTEPHDERECSVLRALELRRFAERDVAIVVAAEPLQSVIAERARGSQLRPEICATYVEALEKLEREGPRVACVVITLENEWAADLYRAVGQRDPAIRRFALIV